jgi:hypothetical protein
MLRVRHNAIRGMPYRKRSAMLWQEHMRLRLKE